jgi:hypothetical protein
LPNFACKLLMRIEYDELSGLEALKIHRDVESALYSGMNDRKIPL